MKKFSLVLGLFALLFAFTSTSVFAYTKEDSSDNNFFTSAFVDESACIAYRRVWDNRIIANSCGGTFNFPNDRVKRGDKYKVEVYYYTVTGGGGIYLQESGAGSRNWTFSANGTANNYGFSTSSLTVPSSGSLSYAAYGTATGGHLGLISCPLPIGSY
jgi:hypothetical protein